MSPVAGHSWPFLRLLPSACWPWPLAQQTPQLPRHAVAPAPVARQAVRQPPAQGDGQIRAPWRPPLRWNEWYVNNWVPASIKINSAKLVAVTRFLHESKGNGRKWAKMGENGRKREKTGENGRKREKTGENGRKREKTGENGRKREKAGESGRKREKTGGTGPNKKKKLANSPWNSPMAMGRAIAWTQSYATNKSDDNYAYTNTDVIVLWFATWPERIPLQEFQFRSNSAPIPCNSVPIPFFCNSFLSI